MPESTSVYKVHAAMAQVLADHGVTTAFGVMGDGNMFVIDSLIREQKARYVAAANEAGAVLMAMGYSDATGGLGLATVTQGPGLANALSALISAAREHVPMLLLTGDTSVRGHTQNIDQAAAVAPTGAIYERAMSAKTAAADLARVLRRALTDRVPVVFALPYELNFADAEYRPSLWNGALAQGVRPDTEALDIACGIVASARRPIVLAGVGAIEGGGPEAARQLAERLGAPLMTTLPAKGLFGYNEWDLGVFGSFSTPAAVDAIIASDCIIALGASLSRLTGGGDGLPYFRDKRIVHCDRNPAVIGRDVPVDGPVAADGVAFVDAVLGMLDEIDYVGTSFRESVRRERSPGPGDDQARPIDGATAMKTLNRVLPKARAITVDGGRFTRFAVESLTVPSAHHWAFAGRGLGAIGNGLPMAIGIGCAMPDTPAVSIIGDGAFMLGGLAEFNTAVRNRVDLIVVICNDGAYGAEFRKLKGSDCDVQSSLFDWPDFAPVAEALGGRGYTVRTNSDLVRVGDVIAARDRPLLIDIKLDPSAIVD